MQVARGSENRKVSFGSLQGGDKFYGSVTGRKFMKLSAPTANGKNCAVVESGDLRKVSDDDSVERAGALKVPFSLLGTGQLFRGTKTPAVFIKVKRVDGPKGVRHNCVRASNGNKHYYLKDTLVEPLSGSLTVEGR